MVTDEKPTPPSGLAERGERFWLTTMAVYELTESELVLLTEACRTMDNLDSLAASIASDGPMTMGSTGQPVVNPALTEARGQRVVLHRLLAALELPDVGGQTLPDARSAAATTANRARWAGHVKVER